MQLGRKRLLFSGSRQYAARAADPIASHVAGSRSSSEVCLRLAALGLTVHPASALSIYKPKLVKPLSLSLGRLFSLIVLVAHDAKHIL